MRILIAHVSYRRRGGEDAVVEAEAGLLAEADHDVRQLVLPSALFDEISPQKRLQILLSPAWHQFGRTAMSEELEARPADVVHFHNVFPMLGLGAVASAAEHGCATVRTVHNWRLSCIAGTHLRKGQPCHDCDATRRRAGIRYGCYRSSSLASLEMARFCRADWRAMTNGMYDGVLAVNADIADTYASAGIPSEIITTKPNSVGFPLATSGTRRGVLYVGRLSAEKGIVGLVRSWPEAGCDLTVVGDGPLMDELTLCSGRNVRFLGSASEAQVEQHIAAAECMVIPSLSDEGPPIVLLRALAAGTPVVAFDTAVIGEVVRAIDSSCIVPLGDYDALAAAACRLIPYRPHTGDAARAQYAARYSHERNLLALESAYQRAIEHRKCASQE